MESLNILRNYFNSKPVPEGCKCLAEERDYINYLIDAVEQEHLMIVQEQNKNENEWMKLPVDSEKEPIHIGDILKRDDGAIIDVIGIGDGVVFYVEDDNSHWTKSDNKTHCSIGDK